MTYNLLVRMAFPTININQPGLLTNGHPRLQTGTEGSLQDHSPMMFGWGSTMPSNISTTSSGRRCHLGSYGLRKNHGYVRLRDKFGPFDGKPPLALYLPIAYYWCTTMLHIPHSPLRQGIHIKDAMTIPQHHLWTIMNHWVLPVLVIFWIHQNSSMCKPQNILVATNRKAAREVLKWPCYYASSGSFVMVQVRLKSSGVTDSQLWWKKNGFTCEARIFSRVTLENPP